MESGCIVAHELPNGNYKVIGQSLQMKMQIAALSLKGAAAVYDSKIARMLPNWKEQDFN